jgi:hypothetical protein
MKCFHVRDTVNPFIPVRLSEEGEAYVPVGNAKLGVSHGIRNSLSIILDDCEQRRRDPEELERLSPEERRVLLDVLCTRSYPVEHAFIGDDCRLRLGARADRVALVLVDIAPGEGGEVKLTARSYSEEQRHPRSHVERVYAPFPSIGIRSVVNDGPTHLLAMSPQSGFRVERNGQLEGAPAVMQVTWSGHQLRVDYPGQRRG